MLASRHIGINEQDTTVMLRKIGVDSLDELIEKTIPDGRRSGQPGISRENHIQRHTGTFLLSGSRPLTDKLRY